MQADREPIVDSVDGIEYWLEHKRVKNVNIRIRPDGRVMVSAPVRMSERHIKRVISEKSEWIQRAQQRMAQSSQARAENATKEEQAEWRAVVEACTPALVAEWEPIIGVKAGKLVYRNMRSRWGSCQPETGRICINTRLALYPPECLEYVVVHELCHFLVHGHGPKFNSLMDKLMPDWKQRRDKLR